MTLLKKKRLLIVTGVAIALAACVGGFVAVRLRTIHHNYLVARDLGYGEYKKGDSAGALRDLGTYLSAYPQDAAALQAFAESRLRVETPDGSYLFTAIGSFRRLADLRPADTDVQRRLVALYARANLNTECVLAVDKLLDKNPDDASLLHARVIALMRLRKYKDALETMDGKPGKAGYLSVRPEDLEGQILRLEILSQIGPPTADLAAAAGKVRTAHPDDVRWKLLQSVACGMAGDSAGSKQWAAQCAAAPAPDAQFARLRVLQLWQTAQVSQGDSALDAAVKQFDDASLRALRVRRLYQLGKFDELTKVIPASGDEQNNRTLLTGYQCLAWLALKDPEEAEELRAKLPGDKSSLDAQDWAAVLVYAIDPSQGQADSRMRIIKDVAQHHPEEAYFAMALADADLAGKDVQSAMHAWQKAAALEPAWATPVTRMAETLLASGRAGDAAKVAQAAVNRDPEDREALVALALASARAGPNQGLTLDIKSLISLVDKIHAAYPEEQRVLALRVSLKTQAGKTPLEGKAAGAAALDETLKLQPPPSLETLLQLAMVSRSDGLGKEEDCYSTAERLYGMGPDLALAKAVELAQGGKVKEGKTLLEENRKQAAKDRQAWDIAYARYLEMNHDPDAQRNWIALSDAYPTDRQAQWLVLSAPSIQADHEVAGRTIERLRAIIGENDFSLKLARASWLLSSGKPAAKAVAEATTMLTDVSKGSPDMLAPHLLLANCLEQNANYTGAIDQLEIAATLAPDSASIAIELARLLQNQGSMERAEVYVNRALGHSDLTDVQRRQCSGLLVLQGQPDRAITLLEAGLAKGGDTGTIQLILATLYAQRGQTEKAGALFDQLMKKPNLAVVRLAAAFYASHNRLADAQHAISELANLKLEPADLAIEEGDFQARFGKPEQGLADYEKALQAAPANVQAWYRLIGGYIQAGRSQEAVESIGRAVTKVPDDKILAGLKKDEGFIGALDGDARSRPILLALLVSPQNADAAELVLARLQTSHGAAAPDVQLAVDISRLADRYPQFAALQNLAVDLDVSLRRLEDAVTIATRAMQTFPSSAEPARLAAAAFAAENRWSETLGASNQWRLRAPDQTMAPDVMIGLSYLGMGRPDDTLRQIEPYMAQAESDPGDYDAVIVLFARSEIEKNHIENAEAKLWPLAKASKRGLASFIQIAAHDAPPAVGERWLKMARDEIKGDMDMELTYISAVAELSSRSGDSALMQGALRDMEQFVAAAKDQPVELSKGYLAIGMIQEGQKTPDSGEASYRRAVELDAHSGAACNNLAMVLARRGALKEALGFANRAVASAPKVAAFQDSLAFVQDKAGDHASAIEHSRLAMQLQPSNPEWRINLAQTYFNAGQNENARTMLVDSNGMPYRPDKLQKNLQDQLSKLQKSLGIHF